MNSTADPDPFGQRLAHLGVRGLDLPATVYLGRTSEGLRFRTASGAVRTLPEGEPHKLVDAENAETFALDAWKAHAAAALRERRQRQAADEALAKAVARLRRELAVILRQYGAPGEAERRPYQALVERGVAREVGERVFVLAVPERDFAPVSADDAETRLWVADDSVMPPGTHRLLGWRGHLPVVGSFAGGGGVALVATVTGRWAVPDAGSRVEWAARPVLATAEVAARLLRRLQRGATITPRDSAETAALAGLASEGLAREVEARTFVLADGAA